MHVRDVLHLPRQNPVGWPSVGVAGVRDGLGPAQWRCCRLRRPDQLKSPSLFLPMADAADVDMLTLPSSSLNR